MLSFLQNTTIANHLVEALAPSTDARDAPVYMRGRSVAGPLVVQETQHLAQCMVDVRKLVRRVLIEGNDLLQTLPGRREMGEHGHDTAVGTMVLMANGFVAHCLCLLHDL